ncbi:GAF domain-containing protein, partial [Vibrio genomosp. F10]|uniref:GAF domain-containing protein n=1 Tax=Vibrio genomosp. F10 TaxID=723171 RepID=UPI00084C63D9
MAEQIGTAEKQSAFSELNGDSNTAGYSTASVDTQLNDSHDDYYQTWLKSHQPVLSGLRSAVVYLPIDNGLIPVATYQENHESFVWLTEQAEQSFNVEQPQVTKLTYSPKPEDQQGGRRGEAFGVLYPLYDDQSTFIAFIAVALEVTQQAELTQAITMLQWSVASLEIFTYQERMQRLAHEQSLAADKIDLLARVLSEQNYDTAAVRLVTELAVLYNCDRVSLGEYKNKRSRLKHLSHSAQFGKKMNLVRSIERVMDECIDQGKVLLFSSESHKGSENTLSSDIFIAHQALSTEQGDISVMSVPIYLHGEIYGAMTMESLPENHWTQEQAATCQSIVSLVMPTLEDKRKNDRSWIRKTLDSVGVQLGRLIGPNYLGRKLFVLTSIVIVYLLATVTGEYKLSTEAKIESAIQRAVVAPYDGYIDDALVRAGDRVQQGDSLVLMDNKDIRLEKLKWLSEQGKLNRQYLEAVAVRDRAKINIINAQQQQVTDRKSGS